MTSGVIDRGMKNLLPIDEFRNIIAAGPQFALERDPFGYFRMKKSNPYVGDPTEAKLWPSRVLVEKFLKQQEPAFQAQHTVVEIPANAPTLRELGDKIKAHLVRMAKDERAKGSPMQESFMFSRPTAYGATRVTVSYRDHEYKPEVLAWDKAREYLAWLDAGNVGTHHMM
jgi:hypothetical protein